MPIETRAVASAVDEALRKGLVKVFRQRDTRIAWVEIHEACFNASGLFVALSVVLKTNARAAWKYHGFHEVCVTCQHKSKGYQLVVEAFDSEGKKTAVLSRTTLKTTPQCQSIVELATDGLINIVYNEIAKNSIRA